MTDLAQRLHITIVAAGDHSTDGLALTHEIELVKAALLYADRVTIASPRVAMVAVVGALGALSGRDRAEALLQLVDQVSGASGSFEVYQALRRKRHKTKNELLILLQFDRLIENAGAELADKTEEIAREAGFGELLPAIEEDLLDLDPLGIDEGDTDEMVNRMSDLIELIVSPQSTSLPMFDDASGGLLRAMVNEGKIPESHIHQASEATLAGRFISWVPAFPEASLETILTARAGLEAPLARYRSAVLGLAQELQGLPVDAEFEKEARDLHRQHVQPALLEIEELSHELGLKSSIARAAQSDAGRRGAAAAVGFAAASAAAMSPVVVSSLVVASDIAAQVFRDRREIQREQRVNKFFFLYAANRVLTKS